MVYPGERERWLSEMVRGGWSQARKRCCRGWDVLLLGGGGGWDELTTLRGVGAPLLLGGTGGGLPAGKERKEGSRHGLVVRVRAQEEEEGSVFANLSAFRLVGKLESWRGSAG